MKDKHLVLESKIKEFNKIFMILDKEELQKEVLPQLLRIQEAGFEYFQRSPKDILFDIWSRTFNVGKYNSLESYQK